MTPIHCSLLGRVPGGHPACLDVSRGRELSPSILPKGASLIKAGSLWKSVGFPDKLLVSLLLEGVPRLFSLENHPSSNFSPCGLGRTEPSSQHQWRASDPSLVNHPVSHYDRNDWFINGHVIQAVQWKSALRGLMEPLRRSHTHSLGFQTDRI